MSKKRRSLADDLAELFNPAPAPELDPETAGVDLPLLAQDDDDFERHAKPTRAAKERGFRLRGDIQLEGKAYTGRKVSRADVFDNDDGDASGSGGDDDDGVSDADEDEDESGGDGEGGDSDTAHQQQGNGNGLAHSDSEGSGDGSRDDSDLDQDPEEVAAARRASGAGASTSGDEGGSGSGSGSGSDSEGGGRRAAGGKEAQQLEAEYRQLQEVERSALEGLKERAQKERQKGRAVAAQQRLYERSLEARILLQKCVTAGNVLPRAGPELRGVLACSEQLRGSYAQLRTEAHETLTSLLELHTALVNNNPAIGQAAAAAPAVAAAANGTSSAGAAATTPGQKRSRKAAGLDTVEMAWEALEAQFAAVAGFRDASLDRWHRRTMLASGGAALKGGGLRALHQSVSAQVANMVRDNTKAVKRTRLTLTSRPRVLCAPPTAPSAADPSSTSAPAAASASEAREATGEEPQDPETFDDAEFYQQLLKELIDFSAGAAGGGGPGYKGQKKRKSVDRRASKGRKIRYHAHEKLVNFTVPVESELPVFAGQLFSNLFGRARA